LFVKDCCKNQAVKEMIRSIICLTHHIQINDNHADVIAAPLAEGEPRQDSSGVVARRLWLVATRCAAAAAAAGFIASSCPGSRQVSVFLALPGDVAGLPVGDSVPQPVAREDKAVVVVRPYGYGDFWLAYHLRLQELVPCKYISKLSNDT
jgi:hypothetical protein